MASSTSRTKKIPQKRFRVAIAKRVVQSKMFVTDGPRCPGKLLKTSLPHRPEEMKSSGPFYLAVIELPKFQVWYKRQRIGIHSINSFMKSMAVQAEIEGKRLTNHSARKTLVKILRAATTLAPQLLASLAVQTSALVTNLRRSLRPFRIMLTDDVV